MKTKPNFQKIRHWLHIAIYILVLLLFANYESQRKQHPERNKLFVDQHQAVRLLQSSILPSFHYRFQCGSCHSVEKNVCQ